ncbi:MAG: hypothetical protein FWH21_00100 [Kiritimatiellaeota bacterium]|nr:hypothetical protein [Kiritimatiellota bacterium]
MRIEFCNGRARPCGHLAVDGAVPFCKAFRKRIADVKRCGPKLIKLALKRNKLSDKLKGK